MENLKNMSEYACTECGATIEVVDEWESMRNEDVLTCPGCGATFDINYEDEETEEFGGYFYLWKATK